MNFLQISAWIALGIPSILVFLFIFALFTDGFKGDKVIPLIIILFLMLIGVWGCSYLRDHNDRFKAFMENRG
jgi:hypothetical protein